MALADLLLRDDWQRAVWVPVLVVRDDGKPCICYAPWDEDCECVLPGWPLPVTDREGQV